MKIISFACALMIAGPALADPPVIRSQSDLPVKRFVLDARPSVAFSGGSFRKSVVPALRSEAERLLSTYRVDDPAIAQQLRTGLAAIAILEDRPADANRLISEQRQAESKPQLRAIGSLLLEIAAARSAAPSGQECIAAQKLLDTRLNAAPADIVRDEMLRRYSDGQTASIAYYAGAGAYMIDDQAQSVGSVDVLDGMYMARWRVIAEQIPACREPLSATFRTWLARPGNRPTDIWPGREPKSSPFAAAKPVVIAVWESGFDPSLFPDQLARDPAEPLDGIDNDGNGVIDDVRGTTCDAHLRPTAAVLPPLSPFLAGRLGLQMAHPSSAFMTWSPTPRDRIQSRSPSPRTMRSGGRRSCRSSAHGCAVVTSGSST